MGSGESQIVCFLDKPQCLTCDSALPSRRKRRELRLLRKVTYHPPSTRGVKILQQGKRTKRTGLRTTSAVYLLDNGILPEESFSGIVRTKNCEGGRLCKIAATELIRSRSFPPEGWKTSEYTPQTSRIGRSINKEKLVISVLGLSEECQTRGTTSLGFKEKEASYVHQSNTGDSRLQRSDVSSYDRPQEGATPCFPANLENGLSVEDPSDMQERDMVRKRRTLDHANQTIMDVTDVLSLAGQVTSQKEEGNCTYSCQKLTIKEKPARSDMNCPPSGKVLLCGRRREMEDSAVICPSFTQFARSEAVTGVQDASSRDLHFFGVYDGHGGSQASNYCSKRLHYALAEEVAVHSMSEGSAGIKDWQSIMISCFAKVDREVGGVCPYGACDDVGSSAACCSGTIAPENVGTTAVAAVISTSQIVVANCGDSRAVLSRGGKAIPLSQDHKPERADETRRIEAAGGRVVPWKGYRVGALLALSRAIGDRYLKRYVISEPDVVCLERTQEDECLILASDGFWDVIDNDAACDVARRCLASTRSQERCTTLQGEDLASATAAATLVKLAYGKGSQDNITVLVVDLACR